MAEYIEREALLKELQEEIDFETTMYTEEQNKWFNVGLKCAVRDVKHQPKVDIESQPTADVVEVKYGYWEIVKGSNGKEKMVCTNCRHQQDLHSTFTYCPNCGALIDGRVIHNG